MTIFAIFTTLVTVVNIRMKHTLFKPLIFSLVLAGIFAACTTETTDPKNEIDADVFDPSSSLNTVFDGKIFSIPSPIQTAYLIKDLNLPFDESLLNDESKVTGYVTEYQQALNLGIYGTDLGYSTLYDQKGVTMSYLGTVDKLTSQLGLDAAFNPSFLKRFEANNDNEDSMVVLMSDAFREADNFLKNSNRKSTSALVLTGGWVESLYFACELQTKKPSEEMLKRIGEQKESLNSIIGILEEYNKGGSNDDLLKSLEGLRLSFDKIVLDYKYSAPETDAEKHITILHHNLNVEVTPAVMNEIKTKISEIRSNIIKV
ncbi:MAG: hypothetical protein ACI837_000393 [Crocinitomicaceae bacterium]|jgi:hypothetical protein